MADTKQPAPVPEGVIAWLREQWKTPGYNTFMDYLMELELDMTELALSPDYGDYQKGLVAGIRKVRTLPELLLTDLHIADDTSDTSARG